MLLTLWHTLWLGWRLGAEVIPLGASTPVSTLGYVNAGLELSQQIQAGLLPEPDRIYIPFATGGTVAGLLIGLTCSQSRSKVVAVRTVEPIIANQTRLRRLIRQTLALLGLEPSGVPLCLSRLEFIPSGKLGRGLPSPG